MSIQSLLPEILRTLREQGRVVIEAPPGAGKTTTIPPAILKDRAADPRQVVVTQPRRIAARLAASYVAESLGEKVGATVGYSVRFEDRTGPATRLRYVTEGVLLQQLVRDPDLRDVHTVLLDEFHERHLETDELLALLVRLGERRGDLGLVVMSATLDAEPIARLLGDCPRLCAPGRTFPLEIRHQAEEDMRPLERRVASAVRSALLEHGSGHVLVFLPGVHEIQRAEELLAPRAEGFTLHVLHGRLEVAAQAVALGQSDRRKVILATNVAESSVTVPGVTAVVDSGLTRRAGFSPWSGRATLRLGTISQASAAQRAGRAGRTGPGLVLRLFSEADLRRWPEHEAPEITRLELTETVLRLLALGVRAEALRWLDPPPTRAWDGAVELLGRLGAIDGSLTLTAVGRRMLRFPLPPRLARMVVSAERLGITELGCLAAAILSERDLRLPPRGDRPWDLPSGLSDVEERIECYEEAARGDFRPHVLRAIGLDPASTGRVQRAARQLSHLARGAPTERPGGPRPGRRTEPEPPTNPEEAQRHLRRCLLDGFSDRVAKHQPQARRLILKNGAVASVSSWSVVRSAPLVVALEEEERSDDRGTLAKVAWLSAIEPEWLLEDHGSEIDANDELKFDAERGRVESVSRLTYGSVVLEESRIPAAPSPQAAELLFEAARQRGPLLDKRAELVSLFCRLDLLRRCGLSPGPASAPLDPDSTLRAACEGMTSLEDLERMDLLRVLSARLTPEEQELLRVETPQSIELAGGRRVPVHYEPGKAPWIAARIQDFFGSLTGPTLCRGRIPLTLQLLAPNQRAVQVTADLSGFWDRHYPELRRELKRRYPKHAWPEDGRTAVPPRPHAQRGDR